MHGRRTSTTRERRSLVHLPTVLFTALTAGLVLVPLLGPMMLPTWAAIAGAAGVGLLLSAIGLREQ
jgi:hypothetical protein